MTTRMPRILVVDDLFGRQVAVGRNDERAHLCAQFLLRDTTENFAGAGHGPLVRQPIAEAVFHRGQAPLAAVIGDTVENDPDAVVQAVEAGIHGTASRCGWSMILLDLCFYTGPVSAESHGRTAGMPVGRARDDEPSGYFGLELLRMLRHRFPWLPIAILSSKNRKDVSREFAARGAVDFIARDDPDGAERLAAVLGEHGLNEDEDSALIGQSLAIRLALRDARRLSRGRRHVLIRGERGTGKELLAAYVHRHCIGGRGQPFVEVNASVLTPELYASELFGHERGAFTGASTARDGLIRRAEGGDLFLDEIGDLDPRVQAGILRVLQERRYVRVGGRDALTVDVRFISATNRPLEAMAAAGTYREDLLDRLREGGSVSLPPLRERKEDIPFLVEHFVREAERVTPGAVRRSIERDALEKLASHSWPGNVREFRDVVFRAVGAWRHVEHLVAVHLDMVVETGAADPLPTAPPIKSANDAVRPAKLAEVFASLRELAAQSLQPSDLIGALPGLQAAYADAVASLLRAALMATRRPTVEEPEGRVLIHPAVKLLTGDATLSASKAADLVKRVLKAEPALAERIARDPVLAQALETALRLRPRGA